MNNENTIKTKTTIEPLSYAVLCSTLNNDLGNIKRLIKKGAKFNEDAANYAVKNGMSNIFNLFITSYPDVFLVTNGGNHYLQIASSRGFLSSVQHLILEYGCDAQYALDEAKKHNYENVVQWCQNYISSKNLKENLQYSLHHHEIENSKQSKI